MILTHDMATNKRLYTRVGACRCIAARSLLMPRGIVGDHAIVAAGAIVTKDMRANKIVAGNPTRIIRTGIIAGRFGTLVNLSQTATDCHDLSDETFGSTGEKTDQKVGA